MADARALTWSPDLSDALGRLQSQMHRLAHELNTGVRSESAIAAPRVKPFVRVETPSPWTASPSRTPGPTWPSNGHSCQSNASGGASRPRLTNPTRSTVLRRSLTVRSGCMMRAQC